MLETDDSVSATARDTLNGTPDQTPAFQTRTRDRLAALFPGLDIGRTLATGYGPRRQEEWQ
ncbi:MAG: hypothetical protein A2V74_08305 [Acidobacteria bacterium RBG_16_70_10]|nr:MAG: hypothetical protein A2V74_08305 [Acidobacteria bacterium RBG_16_70_10]